MDLRFWTGLGALGLWLAGGCRASPPPSLSNERGPVSALFETYLTERARVDPNWASGQGLHTYDDRLTRHDDASRAARQELAEETLARLDQVELDQVSRDERLDARLWRAQLETELFDLKRRDERRIMPGLPLGAVETVHAMLIKDYAPLSVRAGNALKRMEQLGVVFEDVRQRLSDPPRVWTEMAIEDAEGAQEALEEIANLIRRGLPAWDHARLDQAVALARAALTRYVEFLEVEILPRAKASFAAGRDVYEFYLRHFHLLDIAPETLLDIGRREWERTIGLLKATAREIDPSAFWQDILERMKRDHPRPEDLMETYRREVARARRFMIERNVVTLPEGESLEVIETPAFQRSAIPYAAYHAPGPLDGAKVGHFYVTPVDPQRPPEEQQAQLTGHNVYDIPGTVWHEAYPGHHTQFIYAKGIASKIRALNDSPLLSEGWGFYCEELAHESGYFRDRRERLMQLNWRLQRAARVILDVSLHTGRMTFEEAVEFLMQNVRMERPQAEASVRAYTRAPTYFMAYMIGMLEIVRIREATRQRLGAAFSLREFHDRVLAYGNVPPALIEQELKRDWR
ncbi:MAG: DUF885 domain-containing protein [Planctomycetes bacterium]|nr:DUF885 domain-containing protein [Planctomycetota bacterium]